MKFLLLLSILLLVSCFAMPVEEPVPPPPVAYTPTVRALRTAQVMRGDVMLTTNVAAFYVPAVEERLRFECRDYRIEGIFVEVGSYVQEGDLIASFYIPGLMPRYEAARRQEEVLNLSLAQALQNHANALARTQNGDPVDDTAFLSEITRIRRDMEILEMELDFFGREMARRTLLAPISGRVTHVQHFSHGMLTDVRVVATIADHSTSILEVRAADVVPHLHEGDVFMLLWDRDEHEVVVIDPEGIYRDPGRPVAYLKLLDEAVELSIRPSGSITVVLDTVHDALFVPRRAINNIEDRTFVYILNDSGILTIRDVVVGLRGNTTYEVISGLSEGEVIVLR